MADQALAAQHKQIEIRDLRIRDAESQIQTLQSNLDATAAKLARPTPFYKSPLLWFAVGIATSAYLLHR